MFDTKVKRSRSDQRTSRKCNASTNILHISFSKSPEILFSHSLRLSIISAMRDASLPLNSLYFFISVLYTARCQTDPLTPCLLAALTFPLMRP